MQTILRLMTLITMMLGGHVFTSCDGKVSPASSAGSGGASELAPGAPTAVVGTAGDSQVELTWSAPASNSGTSITVYVVQYSSDNGTNWTTFSDGTSTLTSATVTGLTNGTSYVFRVAAKNSNGTGVYSASTLSVTPATTPDAPESVAGTAGNNQVALTWTPPASNGGSAITNYSIQYSSDGGTSWSAALLTGSTSANFTVTGLTNGTTYIFKVAAQNSAGTGIYSVSSPSVTPATTPDAPVSVAGTAGNNQVALTWTPPASNGGSAIANYSIQYSSDGGAIWGAALTTGSTAANFTVTGLTNGTTYIFKVAAKNSAGTGNYSVSSPSVTPATIPGAPTSVSGNAGNAKVELTWTAPASDGGALITDYEVQHKAASAGEGAWTTLQRVASDQPSAIVTGLMNGTSYVFRVAAKNAAGKGSYSESSSSVTPVTTPDAPTAVTAIAGNANVSMSWNASLNNGGALITGYEVQYKAASAGDGSWVLIQSAGGSANVTGLENGTAYVFRVAAKNSVGTGGFTESITITPARAPDAPTGVTATGSSNAQVSLTWTAPANTGGSAITGYSIQHYSNGSGAWSAAISTGSTSTSHTVTGLTNGTAYIFRVAAINALGTGSYSDQSAAITPPWSEVTVESGSDITMRDNATGLWWSNGRGYMNWDTAMSHCGNLSYNGEGAGSWRVPTKDELVAAYNNGIQTQDRTGWFDIFKFREYFWSSVSTSSNLAWIVWMPTGNPYHGGYKLYESYVVCVTSAPGPPYAPPTAVWGTAGNTEEVTLSWTAPASDGGSAIKGYSIQHSSNGGSTWSEAISTGSTSTSHTVTGLTNGTAYVFRVAAVNALGTGSYSSQSASVTPSTPPWSDVTVGSDITMRDNATGFWWSNDRGAMNWGTAMSHCGNLSYNGAGAGSWRVPSDSELLAAYNNGIKTQGRTGWITMFSSWFWSSVSYSTTNAWYFNLANGVIYASDGYKNSTFQVVCVTNAPTAVTGTAAGNNQVSLNWTALANTGGSEITNYSIQYSSDGGTSWSVALLTGSTSANFTVTGLTNGTAYVFRVAAVNAFGTGIYSSQSASVTPGPWSDVTVGSDITMRDDATGLWWSNDRGAMNWGTAMSHCGNLSYNGEGAGSWRVPSDSELLAAYNNGIKTQGRTGWITTFSSWFWSSVSYATFNPSTVNLADGNTYLANDFNNITIFRVVCVR